MNKPLAIGLGVIAAGVAAYLGATAWAGRQIQSAYETQLDKLAAQPSILKVIDRSYDRSLWSATATVTLQPGCLGPGAADDEMDPVADSDGNGNGDGDGDGDASAHLPGTFTLRHHIQHGPLAGGKVLGAGVIHSELVFSEQAHEKVLNTFGTLTPVTMHTVLDFAGGYTSTWRLAAGQVWPGAGVRLAWRPMTGTARADMAGTAIDYELEMDGGDFEDRTNGESVRMKIGRMTMKGNVKPVGGSWVLSSGKAEGDMAHFELDVAKAGESGDFEELLSMVASELRFTADTTVDGELLNSVNAISGSATVSGVKLDRFDVQTSMKRLHAPTYKRILDALAESVFACDHTVPELDSPEMAARLRTELGNLLVSSPAYSLDHLVVDFDGQRGELSYSIGVQDFQPGDLEMELQSLVLTKSVLEARGKLPVAWIERMLRPSLARRGVSEVQAAPLINSRLDQVVAQGYLVREGAAVSTTLRYAPQSGLQLNGRPLPLESLGLD